MRATYSLYKRPPKDILYCQVWSPLQGKYMPAKSTGTANKVKARAIAKKMVEAWTATTSQSVDPIFGDYLFEFWDWEVSPYVKSRLLRRPDGLTKAYVNTNQSFIRRYAKSFFKNAKLSGITPKNLEEFILHLKSTTLLSPRSVNAIYDATAVPIREAFRLGAISSDSTRPIRKLWVPHTEKGIPSTAEIKALANWAWPDERLKLAFLTATICGLRLGEIRGLQREDIGDDILTLKHSFSVVDGLKAPKNGRPRIVTLPAFLKEMLLDLVSHNPHGETWIFWGKCPKMPISPGVIEEGFNTALAAIGIDESQRRARRLSFHSLRHFCNAMLRGAIPDEKLRLLTGHVTESMTEHYDHITDVDRAMLHEAQESRIVSIIGRSA
jgi:integrase